MYFDKTYFDENGSVSEVQLICDKCGAFVSADYNVNDFTSAQNEYCITTDRNNIICKCGNQCQSGMIEPKKQCKMIYKNIQPQQINVPKCPTCSSTNIEKIGGIERGASVAMFGIFSKKINKSFKCKNCGYTW